MKTDQNNNMQGTLTKRRNMKKRKNAKRVLLALNLVAVIFTTTVFSNPVSVLSEEVSTDAVQNIENNAGGDAQIAEQADVQQNTAEAAQAVEAPAAEAPAAENSAEAAKAEEPSGVNAPAENAMSAEMSAAEDGAVSTDDGASSASAVQSADVSSASNESFEDAGAGNTDGTKDGIIENDAEGLNDAEGTAANGEAEDAASQEQLTYADEHVKISASYTDGRAFTADSILTGTYLDSDEKNAVLSAVNAQISKGNSADTVSDTAENTESSGSAPVASTTATTVEYSAAGLHALMLAAKNKDGSDATTEGDITFSSEFKNGLNDAGYSTREENTENNEAAEDGGLTTTTTRCETLWKIYTVTEKNLTDITDITDAHNTHYEMDKNGTLKSASFRGALPQTVAFVQIVKKTVTETTTQKETEKATEKVTEKTTERETDDVKEQVSSSAAMPAVTFDQKVTTDNGTVMVHVEAEEGAFEEGTSMTVTPVTSQTILDKAIDAAGGKGAAVAMDITFTKPDGTKTEPLKPIHVKMISAVLNRADEAHVVHVADSGSTDVVAKKSDGKTIESTSSEAASSDAKNAVSFESDSFSVYAIVYTVDFEYSVNGKIYQFSLHGGKKITLSDLVEVLGIIGDTNYENIEAFLADVDDVTFSDDSLVKIVHPAEDTTVGDLVTSLGVEHQLSATIGEEEAQILEGETIPKNEWTLLSIKPFDTEESLTITMKNGDVVVVKVTDASSVTTSDGIKSLLTDVSITGAKQEGSAYVVYPEQPYGIHLTFKEVNKDNGQFPMDDSFTYQLPAGLVPSGSSVSNFLEITLSGGDHAGEKVKLNYTISNSGLITFNWDQTTNPEAYAQLADSLYSQFQLDIECTYTGSDGTLDFGNDITEEVKVKNNGKVNVNKKGTYNPAKNCVDYTVTVNSDGITKDVVITDTVSGSALTYNRDAVSSSSIYGKEVPSPTSNSNGFTLTIPQMADQETVTVTYSAAVNLDGLTKNPDGTWGTVTETGNKVIVNSKDNPPVEKENSGKNFEHKISMSNIGKSGSPVEADETGHATVNWTIHANDNANVSMAGHTIRDSISGNSVPMSYNSSGIHVVAYNADGSQAYEKDIAWGSDGLTKATDGKSWSWSVPNQAPDTQKLSYVITYTTDVDVSDRLIKTNVKNHAESDNGGTADYGVDVTPNGGALTARKKVVKTDITSKTVTWEINFDVPATGLNSAQIIDTMPTFWENGQVKYFDSYLGNSTITITPELAAGESYEATTSADGRTLTIDFYKTEDEQKVTGLSATGSARKIRVQFQTEFNEDWLTAAEDHQNETNYTNHTNTGRVLLNGQTIGVSATTKVESNEPGMSKVHGAQTTYNVNGNSLPAFPYVVTLEGVTDDYFDDNGMLYVEDSFNGRYLAYYPETQNNNTGDNNLVGYLYGATGYQDLSNGGDPIHNVAGKSENKVVSSPSDGKILISISRDDIPLDSSGNYYPYYYIFYYLTVKDPIALEKLNTAIQQSDSGVYSLLNTVTNQKFGSTTDTAEIEIPVLDKTITSQDGKAYYNNGNWMVDFKLDVNPDALDLGDDEELTLTDDYTNLAVDYTTIKIQKEVNGSLVDTTDADGVSWNRKGNRITYTLQNGVHYVITYSARLTGEPGSDGKVHYDNTAEYFGVKKWTKGDQDIRTGGSGSAPTYGITVFKHEKGAGSSPLSGAKFKLYKYTETQDQENGWENQPSNAINTETRTPVDSGWEAVKEMTTDSDGVAKTLHSDNIQRWTWYMLVETEAPVYEGSEHYQLKDFGYVFWITDKGAADYSHYVYLNDDVVAIDNEPPVPETVDIGVTKTWTNDNGDKTKRKDITVRLYADGVPYADWTDKNGNHLTSRDDTVKVLSLNADGTTDGYTWTGLPGGPVYSVVEDGVAGYTTTYSPKSTQVSGTINIKNKYIPGKTFIHVEKNWSGVANGNQAEDITVQLKRKVSANAEVRFVKHTGEMISHESVPVGSIVTISYHGKDYGSGYGGLIGYTLYDGATIGGTVLSHKDSSGWTDPYVVIENVEVGINGVTLALDNNGTGDFSGNDAQDPRVTVTGGGDAIYSEDVNFNNENHYYTISAANGWKIDIDRLVKEDDDGKYIYYVEEVGVNDNTETPEEAGYTVTYENNDGIEGGTGNADLDTIKVTNSPEPGSLEVTKKVSGADAKGTYKIAVKGFNEHYYALDGTDEGTDPFYVEFAKDDTKKWNNLPAGTYTVEEQDASVNGYTWRVTGTGEVEVPVGETAEAEVTNVYEEQPETGKIIVKKTFKGVTGDDLKALQNGLIVTITGKDVGGTDNNTLKLRWSDVQGEGKTIDNLPLGEKYQITESITGDDATTVLAKYEQVTTGTDASVTSFTNVEPTADGVTKELVNSYEPKTTDFEFSKIWNGIGSQPTTWPEGATITVKLNAYTDSETQTDVLQDQTLTFSKKSLPVGWSVETSSDGKKTTFKVKGLAKYSSDGKELTYYVTEAKVDGYKAPSYATADGIGLVFIGSGVPKATNGQQIINTPEGGYELPSTGGPGTLPLAGAGVLLLLLAGIALTVRKMQIQRNAGKGGGSE